MEAFLFSVTTAYVALRDLLAHIEQACRPSDTCTQPSATVSEILRLPPNTPPTDMEKNVASNIVQRMLGGDKIAQLPTARKRCVQ